MCVIAVCEKRFPTLEELKLMEEHNPDGGGLAWRKDGKVEFIKGLTAEEMFSVFESITLPCIIHFRIATVGAKGKLLCHPFPVDETAPLKLFGSANAVLFHNGTFREWKGLIKGLILKKSRKGWRLPKAVPWSDSRAIACAAAFHGLEMLEFIASGQRFAYFSGDKLETIGDWSTWQDLKVSNEWFVPLPVYVPTRALGYTGRTDYGYGYTDWGAYDDDFARDDRSTVSWSTWAKGRVWDGTVGAYVEAKPLKRGSLGL